MERKALMTKRERTFVDAVWVYYRTHGRHGLPWRKTRDPYRILVSEVMLQQTQVPRVLVKYAEFLQKFPNVDALASAPLGEVLRAWQGLGYNRRAKLLHACAKEMGRTCPRTYEDLLKLPGIGPYTAGAVMAFAYNEPVVIIETNIRTVYLHHFFKGRVGVSDKELLPIIERTVDQENARAWYAALMDYGTHLKQVHGNQNNRSKHYIRQSKFKGSDREIRGAILRTAASRVFTQKRLTIELKEFERDRVMIQLSALVREGMLEKKGSTYTLP